MLKIIVKKQNKTTKTKTKNKTKQNKKQKTDEINFIMVGHPKIFLFHTFLQKQTNQQTDKLKQHLK